MSKQRGDWMQTLWRPMMGWMYMLICLLDMAVFPVLWALWQGINHVPITQWNPLTLQGAGLFHIAMGAVLGISAFGRTQEKLAGTAANPTATAQTITNNNNMTGNVAGGFGSNTGGMGNGNTSGFGGGSLLTICSQLIAFRFPSTVAISETNPKSRASSISVIFSMTVFSFGSWRSASIDGNIIQYSTIFGLFPFLK